MLYTLIGPLAQGMSGEGSHLLARKLHHSCDRLVGALSLEEMAKSHDGVWLDIVTKDPRGEVDAVNAQVKDGTPAQTLFANSSLFGV